MPTVILLYTIGVPKMVVCAGPCSDCIVHWFGNNLSPYDPFLFVPFNSSTSTSKFGVDSVVNGIPSFCPFGYLLRHQGYLHLL